MFSAREFRSLCNLHHLLNMLLSILFPLAKLTVLSRLLFGERNSGLDSREHEILVFLAVIIVWKNRKASNYMHVLSIAYMFSKLANAVLFFRARPILGIVYSALAILLYVLVPEPLPPDSSKIRYFHADELQRTIEEDKSIVWVIEFFSTWSPDCRYVGPVFSALSERFSLPNLRFGKLDVGKHAREGELFRVNSSVTSRQLPTIACFKNGTQAERRPMVGQNRRAIPFVFTEDNIILALDLNNTFAECKAKIKKQ